MHGWRSTEPGTDATATRASGTDTGALTSAGACADAGSGSGTEAITAEAPTAGGVHGTIE